MRNFSWKLMMIIHLILLQYCQFFFHHQCHLKNLELWRSIANNKLETNAMKILSVKIWSPLFIQIKIIIINNNNESISVHYFMLMIVVIFIWRIQEWRKMSFRWTFDYFSIVFFHTTYILNIVIKLINFTLKLMNIIFIIKIHLFIHAEHMKQK